MLPYSAHVLGRVAPGLHLPGHLRHTLRVDVQPVRQNWNAGDWRMRLVCYLYRYSPALGRAPTLREVFSGVIR